MVDLWRDGYRDAIIISNGIPPAKADRAGLWQSPYEKLQREIPSLAAGALRSFRYAGNSHNRGSEPVMYLRKEFDKIVGAMHYHPLLAPSGPVDT